MNISMRRLWLSFGIIFVLTFAILLYFGENIYQKKPPIPNVIKSVSGDVIYTGDDIKTGQLIWQSIGGMELGSLLGHGSYVAPDWNTDILHKLSLNMLDYWSNKEYGSEYKLLDKEHQALLKSRLHSELSRNTFDSANKSITLSDNVVLQILKIEDYYNKLFLGDPSLNKLREQYAMKDKTLLSKDEAHKLFSFFYWITWASHTNRKGQDITYTSDWPYEPLLSHKPTSNNILWSIVSVVLVILGIGIISYYYAVYGKEEEPNKKEANLDKNEDSLFTSITPSQRGSIKYFYTAFLLFGLQVLMGILTSHYSVEGQSFYGIELGKILPYSVTRTWHLQLAIFWIATTWLATGLFLSPALSGKEPVGQKLLVDLLFVALVVIVLGSMLGEWLGVQRYFDIDTNYLFGHQGYEYIDLGRFWQIFLFIGLVLWLVIMLRSLFPLFNKENKNMRHLFVILLISVVAIASMYGSGLFITKHAHISVMEYWRWWVVHLWVEGFFEVFATVIIAIIFYRLRLVKLSSVSSATLFSTIIFLLGGIPGTLHHLYFSGTSEAVMVFGALFSALEVVPLSLIGFEGYVTYKKSQTPIGKKFEIPILFFSSVSFWNLLGAGVFGFFINVPIALYYFQGLTTASLHGHSALFGVYGLLGIGLSLFCLRIFFNDNEWSDKLGKFTLYSLNIGLLCMVMFSLLPYALNQAYNSISKGYWYARSAEVIHSNLSELLVYLRVPGDIIFSIGFVFLILLCFVSLSRKVKNRRSR